MKLFPVIRQVTVADTTPQVPGEVTTHRLIYELPEIFPIPVDTALAQLLIIAGENIIAPIDEAFLGALIIVEEMQVLVLDSVSLLSNIKEEHLSALDSISLSLAGIYENFPLPVDGGFLIQSNVYENVEPVVDASYLLLSFFEDGLFASDLVNIGLSGIIESEPSATEFIPLDLVGYESASLPDDSVYVNVLQITDEDSLQPLDLYTLSLLTIELAEEISDITTYRVRSSPTTYNDLNSAVVDPALATGWPQGSGATGTYATLARPTLLHAADQLDLYGQKIPPEGYVVGSIKIWCSYLKTTSVSTDTAEISFIDHTGAVYLIDVLTSILTQTTRYGNIEDPNELNPRRIDHLNATVRAYLDTATAAQLEACQLRFFVTATAASTMSVRLDGVFYAMEYKYV